MFVIKRNKEKRAPAPQIIINASIIKSVYFESNRFIINWFFGEVL